MAVLALAASVASGPREYEDYLSKPDKSYAWQVVSAVPRSIVLSLTSQTWHRRRWTHTLTLQDPAEPAEQGHLAVLIITGGRMNEADLATGRDVADRCGLPVATLYDIPNQPIFGKSEDELIAETFQRYIDSGDATWPLLFPMAKSVIRAMDAVQAYAKTKGRRIDRFIVTGQSKRGWTAWFVGAAKDKRVAAIVPMIIDNLNIAAQMRHQMATWGRYSDMIAAYTRQNLQAQLRNARGKQLAAIVDPYTYRGDIHAPTLIVNGANDPYWATDALSLYWGGLKQPKSVLYIPNVGHGLGSGKLAWGTVGAFAQSVDGKFAWPKLAWAMKEGSVRVTAIGATPVSARLWTADSDTMVFRDSRWTPARFVAWAGTTAEIPVARSKRYQALFVEIRFRVARRSFSLCTQTWVIRPNAR